MSVFTSGGQFVTSIGRKGKDNWGFNYPLGVAVDTCGVVYVCDHYNDRVQLFNCSVVT